MNVADGGLLMNLCTDFAGDDQILPVAGFCPSSLQHMYRDSAGFQAYGAVFSEVLIP